MAIIHKKNNLAKFGYLLDVKVKNILKYYKYFFKKQNRILLYSWLPTEIYHKNWAIAILKIKNFQNSGEFGSFFFPNGKSFV
jgi:hypothetical protein